MTFDNSGFNFREYRGFKLYRTDPFGFWVIRTDSGQSLKELNEVFTMTRLATKAIDEYLVKSEKKIKKR